MNIAIAVGSSCILREENEIVQLRGRDSYNRSEWLFIILEDNLPVESRCSTGAARTRPEQRANAQRKEGLILERS